MGPDPLRGSKVTRNFVILLIFSCFINFSAVYTNIVVTFFEIQVYKQVYYIAFVLSVVLICFFFCMKLIGLDLPSDQMLGTLLNIS